MDLEGSKRVRPQALTGSMFHSFPPRILKDELQNLNVLELAATIGAQRPAIRLKNEAMPVPVPRFGAGKTSGVL